jgi:uncharacterized protein
MPEIILGGQVISIVSLAMAGLVGGLTAGLLGIGGGALVNPLLIALGVPPRIAVASMSATIISNASGASLFNLRKGKVDWRLGLYMGFFAVLGGQIGTRLIQEIAKPESIDPFIRVAFVFLLLGLAKRMAFPRKVKHDGLHPLLAWPKGLRMHSHIAQMEISPAVPCIAALLVGVLASFLGIGGGVFYVPLLMTLFAKDIRQVVPISQVTVMFGAISVATGHVMHTGFLDPRLSLLLLLSGSVGTAVGSRLKARLDARTVQRLFAFVLLLGALRMGWQVFITATHEKVIAPITKVSGIQSLDALQAWCDTNTWQAWLGGVGLAILLGPLLAWAQHALFDRMSSK